MTIKQLCAAAVPAAVALTLAVAPAASASAPPPAPGNLHVVSVTNVDIVLAWDASSGRNVNYDLFFDDNETPFIVGAHTQFDVEFNRVIGMIPGSTHTFQVRAENTSTGEHSFSNTVTATFAPGDNTPPTAPRNLRVVSNTSAGVELAWDASTDASAFDYHVSGTPCSPLVVRGDTTHVLVPSVAADPVCGLLPGFRDTFAVWARDEFDNDSAFSNPVTVTVAGG
jgi:chitinase